MISKDNRNAELWQDLVRGFRLFRRDNRAWNAHIPPSTCGRHIFELGLLSKLSEMGLSAEWTGGLDVATNLRKITSPRIYGRLVKP
jgi:hypothetical protein